MQLTEAEASFRALNSELSIRPLFHQREPRVQSPCPARVPGLRALGHVETSTQAPSADCAEAIGEWRRRPSAALAHEGARPAVHAAKRRRGPSDYRWS